MFVDPCGHLLREMDRNINRAGLAVYFVGQLVGTVLLPLSTVTARLAAAGSTETRLAASTGLRAATCSTRLSSIRRILVG